MLEGVVSKALVQMGVHCGIVSSVDLLSLHLIIISTEASNQMDNISSVHQSPAFILFADW